MREDQNLKEYIPEQLILEKDAVLQSREAIEAGLEYARECLATHDITLGRTILKNKSWAETMEKDIAMMTDALQKLGSHDV